MSPNRGASDWIKGIWVRLAGRWCN